LNIDRCGVIDLFCGVGGLTHGFVLEGVNVIAGIDVDASCSYAYEVNNNATFINQDVGSLQADHIKTLFSDVDIKILVGCAPCQPFSQYSGKNARQNSDWELVGVFANLIEQVEPEVVSMENVPRLQHHDIFYKFKDRLDRLGYKVFSKVIYGPDYGLPQERERLILLASRLGEIEIISKTHSLSEYKTVRDVIEQMPCLGAGEICENDRLHICSRLSEKNLERIRVSKPGGTWHEWPSQLRAACHSKDSGKGYVGVYGRMEWDRPSPTITTQFFGYGNGRFGHPTQDRAISLREGALLQTFPQAYKFVHPDDPLHIKSVGRHIGNAVPVALGQVIAKSISIHLDGANN